MKFSLGWLKDYLKLNKEEEQRIEVTLLQGGVETERIEFQSSTGFEIVEILEVAKHPNADKLNICTLKGKTNKIVCGASNVRVGLKCILANKGAIVQGKELKEREIRGIVSEGMLCSSTELGLDDDADGLFVPSTDNIDEVLNPDGPVYDLAITPNRGDLMCVYGIARELAAFGVGKLKELNKHDQVKFTKPLDDEYTIKVDSDAVLSMYSGKISNLQHNNTPYWMKRRLQEVGIKSHNLAIDVTNYICHSFGQPLHAFDADVIKQIQVKKVQSCDFTDLKGDQHYLSDTTVMLDNDRVISLPGIIGGDYGKCLDTTHNLLLEAGNYTMEHIYKGRKIRKTRASDFFFHQIDPTMTAVALLEAATLLTTIGGGELSKTYVMKEYTTNRESIPFSGGEKLEKLGFTKDNSGWIAPSWRHDILNDQDLEQELLRLDGYDVVPKIDFVPLRQKFQCQRLQEDVLRYSLIKDGLYEVVNTDFMSKEAHSISSTSLIIENPISDTYYSLRNTLLHGLIEVYGSYLRYGWDCPGIFEIGHVFDPMEGAAGNSKHDAHCAHVGTASPLKNQTDLLQNHFHSCVRQIGIALSRNKSWLTVEEKFRYFEAKQIFEKLVVGLYDHLDSSTIDHPLLKNCCAWLLNNQVIGVFGILDAQYQTKYKIREEMYLGTILLDFQFKSTINYLDTHHAMITRDISLLVPPSLAISKILADLKEENLDLYPFDLHPDANLDTKTRSVGIRVFFNQLNRVMTSKEINEVIDKLCTKAKEFGCEVR